MIFALNSAGVRVFFAHFFEEKFCGGMPLRGAKPCVLGFCVRGVLCVGHGLSWFLANLLLGLLGGCGSLAWRVGAGGPLAGRAMGGGQLARCAAGCLILICRYAYEPETKDPHCRAIQKVSAKTARPIFKILSSPRSLIPEAPSSGLLIVFFHHQVRLDLHCPALHTVPSQNRLADFTNSFFPLILNR